VSISGHGLIQQLNIAMAHTVLRLLLEFFDENVQPFDYIHLSHKSGNKWCIHVYADFVFGQFEHVWTETEIALMMLWATNLEPIIIMHCMQNFNFISPVPCTVDFVIHDDTLDFFLKDIPNARVLLVY